MLIPSEDALIVSIDYRRDIDNMVLIVGRQMPNKTIKIVNAFQGDEAKELYKKLVVKNEVMK